MWQLVLLLFIDSLFSRNIYQIYHTVMTYEPAEHKNQFVFANFWYSWHFNHRSVWTTQQQHLCYTAATDADNQTVQTLNSAMATFGECSMGLRSRRCCISTSRWWFSHSCTARFTSFKIFLLHSSACCSNSYSVVFAATFQQQSTRIFCCYWK